MAVWRTAGILWMAMLCLGNERVSDLLKCPVTSFVTVSELRDVFISCPSSSMATDTEIKYHLFLNFSPIYTVDLKKSASPPAGVRFHRENSSSRFEVPTSSSGMYSCQRDVIYPPPHREDCLTTVVAEGEKPVINQDVLLANQSCPDSSLSVPELLLWVGCGVLLVYSLSITCVAIFLWRKLKAEEEESSEYVNTKPGEFRRPYKV
ncbi:uncharacterized protein LOC139913436 [Centroberyx gerrardi]|uniref:uncharacterized protein n=1 Tax=Centroberyx gerrardi TaxID=166262 RepID=UPI003AAF6737